MELNVTYNFKDFIALNALVSRTLKKVRTYVLRPIGALIGLFLAVSSALILLDEVTLQWSLYCLLGLVTFLLFAFSTYLEALATKNALQNKTIEVSYRFDEESFTQESSQGTTIRKYDMIWQIFCFRERYFVFFDKRYAIILPKRAFAPGEYDHFRAFIEARWGSAIKNVGKQ